jgi:pyridoxine 5-phosphate synthase
MAKLCVNIDHVATLRQARGGTEPDVIAAAKICENAGAAGITVHLREDRRHIQDADVEKLRRILKTKLNLEMALNEEVINKALRIIPDEATIVPEKREELTTEGGLDAVKNISNLRNAVRALNAKGTIVSLFIEADQKQIKAAKDSGAKFIELHTGAYANARTAKQSLREFEKIKKAALYASALGLGVNAGHGLNYQNSAKIASIEVIEDLNTGHSIISRAVFTGLYKAVKEMLALI